MALMTKEFCQPQCIQLQLIDLPNQSILLIKSIIVHLVQGHLITLAQWLLGVQLRLTGVLDALMLTVGCIPLRPHHQQATRPTVAQTPIVGMIAMLLIVIETTLKLPQVDPLLQMSQPEWKDAGTGQRSCPEMQCQEGQLPQLLMSLDPRIQLGRHSTN